MKHSNAGIQTIKSSSKLSLTGPATDTSFRRLLYQYAARINFQESSPIIKKLSQIDISILAKNLFLKIVFTNYIWQNKSFPFIFSVLVFTNWKPQNLPLSLKANLKCSEKATQICNYFPHPLQNDGRFQVVCWFYSNPWVCYKPINYL